jgi:hypothetical protein
MKKLFTLLSIVIVFGANAQTTLIHYWNFKSFNPPGTAQSVVGADTLPSYPADSTILPKGKPNVAYRALPGTSSSYQTFWAQEGAGTGLNFIQFPGEALSDTVYSMKASNPCDSMQLLFTIPTTGFHNITFSYAYELSSAKAPQVAYYDYSTDGGKTFISTGLSIDSATLTVTPKQFYPVSISIGNPAAENNPNLVFRIRQGIPNTGASGNDRYANVQVTSGFPLPLALQSFSGALVNNSTKLEWAASNEVNVKEYAVEESTDKENFNVIGLVVAKNSTGINNYEYTTTAPKATTYYRLKMINKDGSFTYSSIVALNGNVSTKKLTVFPNPAISTITLTHEQAIDGATIKIFSVNGKTVSVANVQTGATQTSIDVSSLIKGSYIVSYENNGSRTITQFVK